MIGERLISATAFKNDILRSSEEHGDYLEDVHYSTEDFLANIDARETVEAIPLSFIYKQMNRLNTIPRDILMALINEWRAEETTCCDMQEEARKRKGE